MSLAIDAILLFSAVFIIWAGASRGFVRSVMSLVSTVAALFAAYAYTPMLAAYIKEKYLAERITNGIYETLKSLALDTETDFYNLDRLTVDLPESLLSILDRYNVNLSGFLDKIRGITVGTEETVRGLAEEVADPTAGVLSSSLAFLLLFIGTLVVLQILTTLLDVIFNLPAVRSANLLLGFLFGALEAAVVALALTVLLSTLVTALGSIEPRYFGADVVEESRICSALLSFMKKTSIADGLKRIYDVLG